MALQGLVFFDGIEAFEDWEFTDVSGITPAIGVMTIYPQYGIPAENGDLVMTYDGNVITIKNAHIDAASFVRNSGGRIVKVRFFDERWAWQFRSITGRYNIRLPNNFVNPDHEQTPQQLATLCFNALGVVNFDVSALPNLARPDVDWDHANAAESLATICDDLGCRIVPIRSTGQWKIVVTGVGADLPDNLPYNDAGDGIDPKETPDYIKIVTAPWTYQVAIPLEAVGRDIDHSWRVISDLSYATSIQTFRGYGFGQEPDAMENITPMRILQRDGTAVSPQELALQTVFRCFRISETVAHADSFFTEELDEKPGYFIQLPEGPLDRYVKRKQVILSDQLVQTYVDELDQQHKRPAYISGKFYGELSEQSVGSFLGSYPVGKRIDFQGSEYRDGLEEPTSFGISMDPIETDRSIITTSKQVKLLRSSRVYTSLDYDTFSEPYLWLTCAIQIRDPETWQPMRYEYFKQIGFGTDKTFCLESVQNDIQPWVIGQYQARENDIISDINVLSDTVVSNDYVSSTNNQDDVDTQCKYYADAITVKFTTVDNATRTYFGLFPIDMDGSIQQVTWRIGKGGADTVASKNTEHDYDIPKYEERRQRDGRKNIFQKMRLQQEIADRRQSTKGNNNTL